MPFTVSHAAAVLPFRRTRLPWAALVIGSFGPDFEYFLRNSGHSRSWHYYPQIVFVCFPFTLLAFYLFHFLLKRPMAGLLPGSLQRRIRFADDPYPRSAMQFVWLFAALWIGIGTHKAWDAFTHGQSWAWEHIAALRTVVYFDGPDPVYGFAVAQTASSVLGLVILFVFFALWYRRTPEHPSRETLSAGGRWEIAIAMVVFAMLTAGAQTYWRFHWARFSDDTYELYFVISSIAWWMWAAVAYSVVMRVRGR